METAEDRPPRDFTRARLPWLVAAAALLVYALTLNRWLQLTSLPVVARVAGWDWSPTLYAPLHFLVTYPFRWLPGAVLPVALNLLAALFAALTLALLARSVTLLPFDRTREARQRERSESGLLSTPLAWVGPVSAALVCGLQLTFWENATVATGEMLDLLLFAVVIWCLLEYRVSGRENLLTALAFIYGLAVTNNYAMIAFFPCFVIALIWVKGFDFFHRRLLGRLTGAGVAGLSLHLLLPAVAAVTQGQDGAGFGTYLRTVLANQRMALASFPPFALLLIGLTTVLPVFLMAVRWPAAEGDTSRAGVVMAGFITRFMHVVMLVAAGSVFFDPVWSPRALGFGRALLPFYYLAALAVGYYVGYLLLMARDPAGRAAYLVTPGMRLLGRTLGGLTVAAALATAGLLVIKNLPAVRANSGRELARLADHLVGSLPAKDAFVLSDDQNDLLLLEAGLARRKAEGAHVLLWTRLMPYRLYHQQVHGRYGDRWRFGAQSGLPETLDPAILSALVGSLAASNQVFYLHPSLGYYFERVELAPAGLVFRLWPRPAAPLAAGQLASEELARSGADWEKLLPTLETLPAAVPGAPIERRYVNAFYARGLASWGALLQRAGQPERARRWLELAVRLNPANIAAKLSLAFNDELRAGTIRPLDKPPTVDLSKERRGWDQLVVEDGLFDHAHFTHRLGLLFMESAYFRQALGEFRRVRSLLPDNTEVQVWEQTAETMCRFVSGDVAGAEAQALALRARHPKSDSVLEALTQIYLGTDRITNALESIEAQIALDPANARALLNKAALCIQIKQFERALPPLDALLKLNPENTAALLNRAIAYLQAGRLDEAARDYETLLKLVPQSFAVHFGLGEIASRKQDKAAALRHFEQYLRYGDPQSTEYKNVAERVRQLKSGGA